MLRSWRILAVIELPVACVCRNHGLMGMCQETLEKQAVSPD